MKTKGKIIEEKIRELDKLPKIKATLHQGEKQIWHGDYCSLLIWKE